MKLFISINNFSVDCEGDVWIISERPSALLIASVPIRDFASTTCFPLTRSIWKGY
mgnify:CR=1 FL=1